MNRIFILTFFIFSLTVRAFSQNESQIIEGAPNVFLDCGWNCDMDNFKREVNYVNFMRERQNAGIYVLVTEQNTGGGDKYILYFLGQNKFKEMNDTLSFTTENDDTAKEISDAVLYHFKKGILQYLLKTPIGEKITYEIAKTKEDDNTGEKQVDFWNSWVFSISGGGSMDGESSYNSLSLRGRFSANKITEKNKIHFGYSYHHNKSNYYDFIEDSTGTVIDTITYTSLRKSQYFSHSYIHGFNPHWSIGGFYNLFSNSFNNINFATSLKAAIEYNIFPYSESDRRKLAFIYKIGCRYNEYVDTTIFDKTREMLWVHNLELNFVQKQKWGSIYFGVNYFNYLHDFRLKRLSFNPNIEWNVAKGLTLGLGGYIAFVSDQITLPKSTIEVSDLLLRRRVLETSFDYWTYFNIRYSFGSKYSNVVNPRFEEGGGGVYFF